jgi:hypothetical protein
VDTCAECGFTYDLGRAGAAGTDTVAAVGELAGILAGPGDLRTRRSPGVWAPIEYACHIRDAVLVQRERLLIALREDVPVAWLMGRDERVEHEGYAEQDPADVARQATDAAAMFANVVARLRPGDWDRRIVFRYPERAERDLRFVAVFTVHEVRHHVHDIRRQLA